MERRSCSNLHFINAMKGNLVSKIRNVDAYGKPALVFKTVKEILEAQDAKKLQPSTAQCLDLRFSRARVKTESFCLPLVERSLENFSPGKTESVCRGGEDETSNDSDEDNYGEMTLRQLKERYKTRKRKLASSVEFKQGSNLEPEEDDSDLREPISSLKVKLAKAKKKCIRADFGSAKDGILIKSERNPDSEMQFCRDLTLGVQVKTEVLEPVVSECQYIFSSVDDCPSISQSDESSIAEAMSDGAPRTVECQNNELKWFAEQFQSCSVNKVSYDHLENNVEPISLCFPICEEAMDVDGQQESCQQFPDLPTSECEIEETEEQPLLITSSTRDDNSYVNCFSRSLSHRDEFLEPASGYHAVPDSNLVVDDDVCSKDLCDGSGSLLFSDDAKKDLDSNQQIDAAKSSASTFNTCWKHPPCLSTDDDLLCGATEQKQPLQCGSPDGGKNLSRPRNHLVSLEDKSTILDDHQQNKTFVPIAGEKEQESHSSSENQSWDADETLSTSLLVQPPERLLLTRKVIPPTSEERLCLAISSAESFINQNNKENPCLSNQTENKASSLGSDVNRANVAGNPKGSGVTNQKKAIISPTRAVKRSKNERRNSPPKGNLEGPRLCRSLPNVSTGCTSLQGCSESAIAFSQRQMHDIESLAVKLMSELKSMKEIVEEKLLFEAYRNASIKNDADEVKDAITNAVKVEETAKKWLSMMARDCSRFCKIMSLTQKGTDPPTSNNGIQRERKKITFADEAGGMLCHVKVFGNERTLESNSEKQNTQTV